MQVVFKNEKSGSRRANSMGIILCTEKISICVEEKCFGNFKIRKFGI